MLFAGCEDTYKPIYQATTTAQAPNLFDSQLLTDSLTSHSFARLSKPNSFGIRINCDLKPETKSSSYCVVFSGRARTNYVASNALINVVSTNAKNEILEWNAISIKYHFVELNEWNYFKDSTFIKGGNDNSETKAISVFAFLGNSAAENYDIDTLNVLIRAKAD